MSDSRYLKRIPGIKAFWIPDITVPYPNGAEIPSILDPASPDRGNPAVKFCRVHVAESDLPNVKNAVAEKDVPEEDRLLVNLCALQRESDRGLFCGCPSGYLGVKTP